MFIKICDISEMENRQKYKFDYQNKSFLLICSGSGNYYIIENRCGHLGIPLDNGEVRDNSIVCPQHGIEFNLENGMNVNRPLELTDSILRLAVTIENSSIGFEDDSKN